MENVLKFRRNYYKKENKRVETLTIEKSGGIKRGVPLTIWNILSY